MTVVLLLHAFPLDARMWDAQVAFLEEAGYDVIAPNLPGREQDSSFSSWASRILELLPGDFVPVGTSMGGYLAFELWRQASTRIPAVGLIDTRATADSSETRDVRDMAALLLRESGFDPFWDDLAPTLFSPGAAPGLVERARAIGAAQPLESLVASLQAMRDRPDSLSTLPGIDVPVLVVVGEKDAITPPRDAAEMAAALPNARVAQIPEAGHLTPLERPHEVNEELLLLLHEALP
ncbi:MAG: alpha/beta fold hydrolase [Gaiellaceae bacterium]